MPLLQPLPLLCSIGTAGMLCESDSDEAACCPVGTCGAPCAAAVVACHSVADRCCHVEVAAAAVAAAAATSWSAGRDRCGPITSGAAARSEKLHAVQEPDAA